MFHCLVINEDCRADEQTWRQASLSKGLGERSGWTTDSTEMSEAKSRESEANRSSGNLNFVQSGL